ncbi:HPr kinase/phosphatase C-terminal domain-containing protein [Defluviimonas sp. WL0002]|uniref:HPr kinase/phosphatase C-terminal domain-containing protein n=1 Tax=Albidovulum marisflavi TaxID=2984159 RepID=A0ABT2Z9Q9_9RHOB|nr:HPr kinase/phosphatase C-terminal domain-containing protein [Defluviimonas sp. WL0002]MCV2867772.1 HPr kinase/phosphatase C-terminal domain-containing protein [Defluviimonas sp. WL0002]
MTREAAQPTILHAACVSLDGRGVLILGPSGSGKSALSLQLMAYGCALVADDGVEIVVRDGVAIASAPPTIRGLIEARGIGLLAAEPAPSAPLVLAVDLSLVETDRLPPFRQTSIAQCVVPVLHRVESAHFPAAILQYLKAGRRA